jgi:dTDP-4-amino-4,6-dideoxygalactose transaminase
MKASNQIIEESQLAMNDGIKVRNKPFAPWPSFAEDDLVAVSNVLLSGKVNYWTGTEGREFEKEFSNFCGAKHSIAIANGTLALELALWVLGIGPGDEVVTTPRTFIASASCIVMRGATPVIADVDQVTQNITAESIEKVLTSKTKAIICVHIAGWPCDMDPILDLAKKHNLKVIEDCAQSIGTKYKGRMVGSIGDIGAFSFCQDKQFTTGGEGGMFVTNSYEYWNRAWSLKDHGKDFDVVYNKKHPPGFRWLHEDFGSNYRMTEMQSALGRVLLRKLPAWIEKRRSFANILSESFKDIEALRVTIPDNDIYHSYYKYYAFVRPEKLKLDWNRDKIVQAINEEGVPCLTGSCSEIYKENAFLKNGFTPNEPLKIAKELGDTAIMFMVHPTLEKEDIFDICKAVEKVFLDASI